MSERVERRLLELLDHPTESPYGNPIPGLDELGEAATGPNGFLTGLVTLVQAAESAEGGVVVVRRLGEPLQSDHDLLARLATAGVRPGGRLTVGRVAGGVSVKDADGAGGIELADALAGHVFVAAA